MRAVLRGTMAWLAAGLLLAPAIALAQNAVEPPPAPAPAPDTVGPRELQNFSLPGTVSKPAEQQPAPTTTTPSAPRESANAVTQLPPPKRSDAAEKPAREAARRSAEPRAAAAQTATPVAEATTAPPPASVDSPAQASLPPPPAVATPAAAAGEAGSSFLPWVLAALVLAGGIAFLLWRRRPREALVGAAETDRFVAPEPPQPAPAPRPAPPAPRATQQSPRTPPRSGIVATGLRPSLEIGIEPLRCVVDDQQVVIEFAIDLFNAGTAPARAVLAEASLLNAGATQEQELAAFFANPVGAGQRLDAIQPLGRVTLTSQVVAPRGAVQEYELAGRKAFVPVIAFNALYEWSGRKGQTSAAYLVGRKTTTDKLGPLHVDAGAGEFRGLATRPLPTSVRT